MRAPIRNAFPWTAIGATSVTLLLSPSVGFGGADRITDQSASATAQGNAFVAQADDPSAIYYNPAGMTQLRGVQLSIGTNLAGGSSSFHNAAGQTAKGNFNGSIATPPPSNFYLTANLKDLGFSKLGDLSIGLGVLSPFGTLIRWPQNGPFKSAVTFAALQLIDIKPTIAYKVNDWLSLGAGLDIYTFSNLYGEGQLELQSVGPPLAPPRANAELNGRDSSVGFNVSFLYTPFRNEDGNPLVNIGFIYRTQATFRNKGQFLINGAAQAGTSQSMVLPQILTGGLALWPIRNRAHEWKWEMDVDYTGWQSVRNLDVRLSNGITIPFPQNWRSTYTLMVGTEYKWLKPRVLPEWNITLRGGYAYSQTPIPNRTFNPFIPDSDNHAISMGLGFLCKEKGRFFGVIACGRAGGPWYAPKSIGLDTAFQVILFERRAVSGNLNPTVDGIYKTTFYVGSLNLRMNF